MPLIITVSFHNNMKDINKISAYLHDKAKSVKSFSINPEKQGEG